MDKNKSIVKIEGLFKAFNNVPVLRGLGLEVSEGSFISIIGPSGCGKTTLLRCLNGLEHPDAGMIEIAGSKLDISGIKESCENLKKGYYPGSVNATDPDSLNPRKNGRRLIREKLHEFRDKTGLLFQGFNLFPHLNVLDNVALAPRIVNNQSREKSEELAKNLLDKVGLKDYIKRWPSQLSGGQLQRVAIARALAMNPGVMLYDEPTSALDPSLVNEIYVAMMKLKDEGITQIAVTHSMDFARSASDQIYYMEEGSIVESGTPDIIFSNPSDERTRKFLRIYLEAT